MPAVPFSTPHLLVELVEIGRHRTNIADVPENDYNTRGHPDPQPTTPAQRLTSDLVRQIQQLSPDDQEWIYQQMERLRGGNKGATSDERQPVETNP